MISLLQADYALQKVNGMDKTMERRVRFISSTHDTSFQIYTAWFYVIKQSDGEPKWCSCPLQTVAFNNPDDSGFQTARRINLNICEYISSTVFDGLRKSLAGAAPVAPLASTQGRDPVAAGVAHLNTPSESSAEVQGEEEALKQ